MELNHIPVRRQNLSPIVAILNCTMSDSLLRKIRILQRLPRWPKSAGTQEIRRYLESLGLETSLRNVQRDLIDLSCDFPLLYDEDPQGHRWYWDKNADLVQLPGMDTDLALTFTLVERYLKTLLPPGVLDKLNPHFQSAQNTLNRLPKRGARAWKNKVAILPRNQKLLPAHIQSHILEQVTDALFFGQQLKTHYLGRSYKEAKEVRLNPLALVFRDSVIYLLATKGDEKQIRQYSLHRFKAVKKLPDKARPPQGFSLDQYISEGHFDYGKTAEIIDLKVLFDAEAAVHLSETPISEKQSLSKQADGRVLLKAEVINSSQLRWWLLGFGAQVEVVGPKSLRDEFREIAQALLNRYQE